MLREEPATREAAIIVVTGTAVPGQIERARRSGADEVLVKPASPALVRERAFDLLLRSRELRADSNESRARAARHVKKSRRIIAEAETRHRMMSRSYSREATTMPPTPPPALRCPGCDHVLTYDHSNIGGVSPKFPEQWDYFRCVTCGAFQYRHRTRRLRHV